MFFTLISYLKFLIQSKNEHSVHSPFVFSFITKCLYNKKNFIEYEKLVKFRNLLYQNKQIIQVTDYGAGSRVFNSNSRQVSKIAKTAGISKKRAKILFLITNYFKPNSILEFGTSLGLATLPLFLGNKNAQIITVEGCFETIKIAKNNSEFLNKENINFINSRFTEYLNFIKKNTTFDLIYFDGNHSKDATIQYFEKLIPTKNNDSIWIFDDIHWSEEMENAWGIIKNHPEVTVTIDTFQWGIIFFRKQQAKEHFNIRV